MTTNTDLNEQKGVVNVDNQTSGSVNFYIQLTAAQHLEWIVTGRGGSSSGPYLGIGDRYYIRARGRDSRNSDFDVSKQFTAAAETNLTLSENQNGVYWQ